jgi:hypothetical protein
LRKWVARFKADGVEGLMDRSSRPHHLRAVTPEPVVRRIIALRRLRWTGKHIARETGVSPATVSRVLHRAGLSRLRDLDPPEQVRRYEREAPGDLIHIDIKKLGRFERPGHRVTGKRTRRSRPRSRAIGGYGWEYVHVCIDDHSRLSFSQIHSARSMPMKKRSVLVFTSGSQSPYTNLIQAARCESDPCHNQ